MFRHWGPSTSWQTVQRTWTSRYTRTRLLHLLRWLSVGMCARLGDPDEGVSSSSASLFQPLPRAVVCRETLSQAHPAATLLHRS